MNNKKKMMDLMFNVSFKMSSFKIKTLATGPEINAT